MSNINHKDFTFSNYRKILNKVSRTHKILSFRDIYFSNNNKKEIPKKHVILRHDVEVSVNNALKLAEIDASLGISSTFFLLTSSVYNIFSPITAEQIRKIISLGHDIGLHYDSSSINNSNPVLFFKSLINIIESFFNIKIYSVSEHYPMRNHSKLNFDGYLNAYDETFFNEYKYLSDSNQAYREPIITEQLNNFDRFQLLLHENCWSNDGHDYKTLMLNDADLVKDLLQKHYIGLSKSMDAGTKLRSKKDKLFKDKI